MRNGGSDIIETTVLRNVLVWFSNSISGILLTWLQPLDPPVLQCALHYRCSMGNLLSNSSFAGKSTLCQKPSWWTYNLASSRHDITVEIASLKDHIFHSTLKSADHHTPCFQLLDLPNINNVCALPIPSHYEYSLFCFPPKFRHSNLHEQSISSFVTGTAVP